MLSGLASGMDEMMRSACHVRSKAAYMMGTTRTCVHNVLVVQYYKCIGGCCEGALCLSLCELILLQRVRDGTVHMLQHQRGRIWYLIPGRAGVPGLLPAAGSLVLSSPRNAPGLDYCLMSVIG